MKIRMVLVVFLVMSGIAIKAHAQVQTIKLVNQETNQPIKNANYAYANQQGISSTEGEIPIHFQPEQNLTIAHLQFGKQKFSPKEVLQALQDGQLMLVPHSHLLQPVTLISIHPSVGEHEKKTFQEQDKLAYDAGQILNDFSSISSIRRSGSYGFDPVLRGFKFDQINVVIDGLPGATASCPSRMDPGTSQVPVNMVSQAEILKGPYSLRYGNAFGGTINFKSAPLQFSKKPKFHGRLGSSYETNGQINRTEGLAKLNAKAIDFSLFGALSSGNDYTDGDGVKIPAHFYRSNAGGNLGLKLTPNQQLLLNVSHNHAKDIDFPSLAMDSRNSSAWLLNLKHEATFTKSALSSWKTALYTSWVDHLMDNKDKMMMPRMVDASSSVKSNDEGGRTELRFDFSRDHLVVGTDMHVQNVSGTRTRSMLMGPMAGKTFHDNIWQDALISKNGLFAEYHFQRESYSLVFSGRMEYNHAEAQDPDSNFASLYSKMTSNYLNPAFSLGGTKMLGQKMSLGLWLGSAQRSGSMSERYINYFPVGIDPYELIGNPQLKPETNNQSDLIFNYKTEKTAINIDLFAAYIHNYISSRIRSDLSPVMSMSTGVRQYVNVAHAVHAGFEASWQQILGPLFQHRAELAYTYGQNTTTKEPLPEIPPMEFRYRLIGSFVKHKLQVEASFRHAFAQNRIAKSYGETKSPAFNVVDLNTSCKIIRGFSFSVSVKNIFNEAYYEHLARSVRSADTRPIYSPGRSFYFSLTYHLM
ncbi:MAG TPA: TonB-dependent receptor [Sunxiuqinia sp.]|nr:TonB-dependent receptor [Sunxiuqinia sp.]